MEEELRGWKAIADSLGASPRTAQRWERDLRLPVRRAGGEMSPITQVQNHEWARTRLVTVGDNGAMFICEDRDLRMNLVRVPFSR
jgi:hypothetical protein